MRQRDENRDRSCVRKVKHTKAEARRVLDRLRSEGRTDLTSYHCGFCGGYHIGNSRGRGARQRNREKRGVS